MSLVAALTRVGVIGSAGRKGDAKKMTKAIFDGMVAKMEEVITNHFKLDLSQVHLVSGGAAWAGKAIVLIFCKGYFNGGIRMVIFCPFRPHCCSGVPARKGGQTDSALAHKVAR